MRLSVPERDIVVGEEVERCLRLLCRSLGLGFVGLSRPGMGLLTVGADGRTFNEDMEAVPRLFQVAGSLRQRLVIEDLENCASYCATRLPGIADPLRFFASAPLIAPSGAGLGALCVMDTQPQAPDTKKTAELVELMEDGARLVVSLLTPQACGATLAQLVLNLAQAEGSARIHAAAEQRYRKMYERASALAKIGVWECDLATRRLTWTDGVYDIFGLPRGSRVTREMVLPLYDPASRRDMERLRQHAIETKSGFTMEVRIRDLRGTFKWVRLTAEVEVENGVAVRIFGLKQDVTEERHLLEQLRQHAEHDALTGLFNRAMFEQCLAAQENAPACALLLLDLDGFKAVNDTYGHAAGDACLVEVATRLRRIFHGAELIARIGGDEFAVLVRGRHAVAKLEGRARAAVAVIAQPIAVNGQSFTVGASIGIARAGEGEAGCVADLFARADCAMYLVKKAGDQHVGVDAPFPAAPLPAGPVPGVSRARRA